MDRMDFEKQEAVKEMKRNFVYALTGFIVVLSVSGCSCKHWDWVCTSCVNGPEPVKAVEVKAVEEAIPAAPVAVMSGAYNFGDHKSSTLTTKAWQALAQKNIEAVLVYTNKCIEMYAAEASKMHASLTAYPSGDPQEVFSYWALNDVGTCLFIQGEAYRMEGRKEDALKAYKRMVGEYSYAQCWDSQGWFWKPADAAQQKVAEIEAAK